MYKKILVPLDGSELAERALLEAEQLARMFGSEIILFEVVPFMPIYGSPELVTPLIVDEKQRESVEAYLAKLAGELKQKGFSVSTMVKTGQQVALEIIEFAKRMNYQRVALIFCVGLRKEASVVHKVPGLFYEFFMCLLEQLRTIAALPGQR